MTRKLARAALSGAAIAALVFVAVLYVADLEITEKPTAASSSEVESSEVPSLVGMELPDASARAADAGLVVKVDWTRDWSEYGGAPSGVVEKQSPGAGSQASTGDTVRLTVPSG